MRRQSRDGDAVAMFAAGTVPDPAAGSDVSDTTAGESLGGVSGVVSASSRGAFVFVRARSDAVVAFFDILGSFIDRAWYH